MSRQTIIVFAALIGIGCFSQQDSSSAPDRGTFTVHNAGADEFDTFEVLGTYKNDTDRTFGGVVVIKCDALDAAGTPVGTDDTPIFAHERGAIGPGFETTVEMSIPNTPGVRARCAVTEAR